MVFLSRHHGILLKTPWCFFKDTMVFRQRHRGVFGKASASSEKLGQTEQFVAVASFD